MRKGHWILCVALSLWVGVWNDARAEGEPIRPVEAQVLGALPPELVPKIRELAQLLQQSIRDGQVSDGQIHQELQSGNLEATIRGLGPDADRLFEEIKLGLRSGSRPQDLENILQGVVPTAP